MNAKYKKHLPYLVFIVVLLLLGFSSAIFHVYLFHDDIFFWEGPSSLNKFPLICSVDLFLGRYIGAFILWSYFFAVKTITDLNKIRLISSLVISCCALGSYGLLLKYLKRPIDAALSAVMLFSLPAFEVWSSHVGESFEVYALIFVIIAVYIVDKIPLEGKFWKRFTGYASLISIFLLICSCMVYPPLATFYWPMALVLILAQMENDVKALRNKIVNVYIPGVTAIFLYACIYKFRHHFFKIYFVNSYHPDVLTSNIIGKFLWFFQTVIPQSLNLWNIFPDKILPTFLGLLLAGAITITLIKEWKAISKRDFWLRVTVGFLITSSILIFSYLPNLLGEINFNPYRCGAGLTAVCVIFLIWALRTYSQYAPRPTRSDVATLILCIACFWGIFRCFDNIDRFRAQISHLEYFFIQDSIKNFHGEIKEIYLIPPRYDDLYHYYDEFGVSTFNFSFYSNVVNLINAIIVDESIQNGMKWVDFQRIASPEELKSVGSGFYYNNCTYKYSFEERLPNNRKIYPFLKLKIAIGERTNAKPSDSTLLIDMNDLYSPLKQIMGHSAAQGL